MRCNLAVIRAVDPVESDAFSVVVVRDFDSVAVEGGHHPTSEIRGKRRCGDNKDKTNRLNQFHSHCPTELWNP